jgi:putative transposase
MGNYRTLLLKYNLMRLPPDVAEKISDFLKIQEEFRKWATEWALRGGTSPLPKQNPLKYFANKMIYAGRRLSWLKGLRENGVKVGGMRPPLFFSAQLRLEKERDTGSGVFVDLPLREVRIRRWSRGNTIALPISEHAVKWILRRVQEGGKLALAAVWVGRSRRNRVIKLYVALTFRREVALLQTKQLLVVDFNALHNGLHWAIIDRERIVVRGALRPNISRVLRLQKVVNKLDRICNKDKACEEVAAAKSKIWRILRSWEDEAVKKLVHLAIQYKAAIVVDLPRGESIRKLKEGSSYASRKKVFLNFGRLCRRIRGLAEWYGIPYREVRLYSSICPRCERKMTVLPNRRVRCACGFEAHRDEVPLHWAMRLFPKLVSFSSSPFSWEARGGRRLAVAARASSGGRRPARSPPRAAALMTPGGGFCVGA